MVMHLALSSQTKSDRGITCIMHAEHVRTRKSGRKGDGTRPPVMPVPPTLVPAPPLLVSAGAADAAPAAGLLCCLFRFFGGVADDAALVVEATATPFGVAIWICGCVCRYSSLEWMLKCRGRELFALDRNIEG